MSKIFSLYLILVLSTTGILSQVPESERKSIHQIENDYYSANPKEIPPPDEKGLAFPSSLAAREYGALKKMVLGWHPYWASPTAHESYDYTALSHIAYFSYEVDTATGGYLTIHNWNTTPIIDYAHQRGTRVLLTVTNFGSSRNTELLSDTVKQKVLINTLISLLKSRNGDGVNFDLESVSSTQKSNLVNFMLRAVTKIKAELPDAEISMATPAVDWSGSWDFRRLSELCDYLIVMGYDYYWSGSSTAGPVAPLTGENYNITRTVTTYLNSGVLHEKLALGVPWYGYDWPVVSQVRKAAATAKATARIYSSSQQLAETYTKKFDDVVMVPWVSYNSSGTWRQLWFEDTLSLSRKYNLVKQREMAGIGIWALSYEGSYREVWNTISNAFAVDKANADKIINVYPNPGTGLFKIDYSVSQREDVSLKIIDTSGRLRMILPEQIRDSGFYSEDFDCSSLEQGLYICVLKIGKVKSTGKIIIIK
jgi:spore germination protein YaaH